MKRRFTKRDSSKEATDIKSPTKKKIVPDDDLNTSDSSRNDSNPVVTWALQHFKTSGGSEPAIDADIPLQKTPPPFYEIPLKRTPSPKC